MTRVLYVTGSCLTRNTSANISHNAFVRGLLENDCEVDIVMADDSWGAEDCCLPCWEQAHYYRYSSISFPDRIRKKLHNHMQQGYGNSSNKNSAATTSNRHSLKAILRITAKKLFYQLFPRDPLYPLEKKWLRTASHFRSDTVYDYVISNSSPSASHRLIIELKKKGNLHFQRWIQIWEDPWYFDLYGGHSEKEKEEEHFLLQEATEIVYVSPLTLMYQKRYFPDCAEKMRCVPLPAMEMAENSKQPEDRDNPSFGYFGDYYSATRDIRPFYSALKRSGFRGLIFGDSDINLAPTDNIQISGRVTLDVLSQIQQKSDILVHLSNLHGGQIPGKIYHYSVTNKPILFILDGTEEEKAALQAFFESFDRYYFCQNDTEEILSVMKRITKTKKNTHQVAAFLPQNVVKELIQREV